MLGKQVADQDINQGIFDAEELELKLEIRNIRKEVIHHFVRDGIPKDNRDIRMLNEIMTAVDQEVTETAKLRSQSMAQKGDEALKLAILEKLSSRPTGIAPVVNNPHDLLEVDVLSSSLKEGEELNVDDFIAKD